MDLIDISADTSLGKLVPYRVHTHKEIGLSITKLGATMGVALLLAMVVVIGYDSVGINKTFTIGNQQVEVVAGTNAAEAHMPFACYTGNRWVWHNGHFTYVKYLWSYRYYGNHWHRYQFWHWGKYVGTRDFICNYHRH